MSKSETENPRFSPTAASVPKQSASVSVLKARRHRHCRRRIAEVDDSEARGAPGLAMATATTTGCPPRKLAQAENSLQ